VIWNRKELARKALASALQTRHHAGKSPWEPICVYDLAEKLKVEVRFLECSSMEGIYSKEPGPVILLPAKRPASRQAYSCAHELGHHIAGHGTRMDELLEERSAGQEDKDDPDEFLVDCFAGFLLMPKLAVERAIKCRGWTSSILTAEQTYTIAGQLRVGYTTLIQHMRWSLKILPCTQADKLLKFQPKRIRRAWLDRETTANLLVVDEHWCGRPIDLHVGDYLVIPRNARVEASHLEALQVTDVGQILEAKRPGLGQIFLSSNNAAFVRVSRAAYVGLAKHRHLEDVDA